jgi:hypothetical protein
MTTAAKAPGTLWVRIHPVDRQKGFVRRTFLIHKFHTQFDVTKGWYEVDERIAKQLVKFRNDDENPASPRVFQVCTQERALQIDEQSKRRAAEARNPNKVRGALKDQRTIPQPVIFPKDEPIPAQGEVFQEATLEDAEDQLQADLDQVEESEALAREIEGSGSLTTDHLGTVEAPRKFIPEAPPEAKPVEVAADAKAAPAKVEQAPKGMIAQRKLPTAKKG